MDLTWLTNSWGSLKAYLMETGLKRILPIAVGAALSSLLALAAAHQGLLENWGITVGTWPLFQGTDQPSGTVIVVELATLSKTAIVALTALTSAIVTAVTHATIAPPKQPDAK